MRPPPQPFHLPIDAATAGAHRWRFALLHEPRAPLRGRMLYVHGFAEEMNKARRMAALQSAALAQSGFMVLQVDLDACGDSPGEWRDTSWAQWVDDIVAAGRWLMQDQPNAPFWLWGTRLGALLAAEALPQLPGSRLLVWQPVLQGKAALQQFLRLRLAADLAAGANKGLIAQMKAELDLGRSVDVAGYTLPAALAQGMERASFAPKASGDSGAQLLWFEVSPQPEPALLPASGPTIERWRAAGWQVDARCVAGPQFWQTTEIETAPALLDSTVAALLAAHPKPASVTGRVPEPAPSADASEWPLCFACGTEHLPAVLHRPTTGLPIDLALLIIVGGPQYRAGSHRQFVQLARAVAASGLPVMRFDVRGMGDATGEPRGFENQDEDVAAAIDALLKQCPTAKRIALWGLCDGASAALMYWERTRDPRVAGLALANPWVRSSASEARTLVRHYYIARLRQPEFWKKLFAGGVALKALLGLLGNLRAGSARAGAATTVPSFQQLMVRAWKGFDGSLLLLVSGRDLTAREFLGACASDPQWREALKRPGLTRVDFESADHTFSGPGDADACAQATCRWLAELAATA